MIIICCRVPPIGIVMHAWQGSATTHDYFIETVHFLLNTLRFKSREEKYSFSKILKRLFEKNTL